MGVAALAFVPSLVGAPKFWVGDSGTTNAPTGGTWQTTTPTVWSDGTVDTANAGWVANDSAFFGGVDGEYQVTIGGAVSGIGIQFGSSGYTLVAPSARTVSMPSASGFAAPQLRLGAGVTATIGTNVTVQNSQSTGLWIGADSTNVSGTLNIYGKVAQNSANTGGLDGYGTVVNVLPGGSLLGPTGSSSGGYVIGRNTGADCTVNVNGGTFGIISGNTVAMTIGGGGTGTVNVVSGEFLMSKNTGNGIVLGSVAGIPGILNLNGGVTTTPKISMGAAGTESVLNFNGGTLRAIISQASFINGLTTANVRNGGAVIDTAGFAVTVGQTLQHSTIPGDAAIDGGLTKLGGGTLTLTGANTYNGPTTVSAGYLVTTPASIGGGAYTVMDGAALGVQVDTPGTSLMGSSLTLGTSGELTNNFVLGFNASESVPAIAVTGALNLNGTVRVNVSGDLNGPSTNLLISYGSISGSGSFVAGTLPSVPGMVGLLVNDTTAKKLKLVYLPPSAPVQWATTSGNWDTTTPNWQPLGGGSAVNYVELSPVTFDDTAPAAPVRTVTLTGDRTPTDVTVSSASQYVFAGNFSIDASGTLIKDGGGTLVLGVDGKFANSALILAGTLQVGNGGTSGSFGSTEVQNFGGLVFNRSDALSVPGIISGSGGLTNTGAGTVSLLATNSYYGHTAVNAGKLVVSAASSGMGTYSVADGATLEVRSAGSSSSLFVAEMSLGSSGSLTNNFMLGTGRTAASPLVYSFGNINLNGTVTVNVSGMGLSAGTYVLLQYGVLSGSGSFVAGALPGISTLTNDTSVQQLKLIVSAPGLVWDAGNTNNGTSIEAGSGTWDFASDNLVWNNAGENVAFANGNSAIFGGADGDYHVRLAASVNAPNITFLSSGYTLTNDTPQTVTLVNVSTTTPKLVVAGGKTATIGTNVTISSPNTTFIGNSGDKAGGTIIVENGGTLLQTTANTYALEGAGTLASIRTGGVMRVLSGSTSGQLAIGVNNTGNGPTLSVDGGLLEIQGVGGSFNVGNGVGPVSGTLTINSGSAIMPAGTIRALTLGVNAGNMGTLNLNGGTLSVARVTKGDFTASATNNFNGGTLKAVNASFGSTFLSGLDRANVRNGGAFIDNGGFAIAVDQPLEHSDIPGDNAIDGGLVSSGNGTLTLGGLNTYTGGTIISSGTLALGPASSIATSAGIDVRSGATFDVIAVAFTLGGSQTLTGGGTINGSVVANGTIAPGDGVGTLTFNNDLTLLGNMAVEVNKSLPQPNDQCVVNGFLNNGGTGTITVTNLGPALAVNDTFVLFNQPVPNGDALTVTSGPGSEVVWENRLSVDGTIKVLSAPDVIPTNPTNITVAVSGGTMTLSWPESHQGWVLQVQTNSLAVGLNGNWFDVPGSESMTSTNITVSPATPALFFRLRYP